MRHAPPCGQKPTALFQDDSNVPPIQIGGSLPAEFLGCLVAIANFDTLLVHAIHQARDGAHPFPAEVPGSIEHRRHGTQQIAIP